MAFDLAAYLDRIGFSTAVRPDLETLTAVHRAHLSAIPYENLDIHLGRKLRLGADHGFDKLVTRHRGGWCYEMNELLITALAAIGFKVYRAGAGVHRELRGDVVLGNHLIGIVDLGERYIVDVGFGDGPLDPMPLREGKYRHGAFEIGLARAGGAWWRFLGHDRCAAKSFDFTEDPRELDWFAAKCAELQTSPESGFVKTAVIQRRLPDRILVLRDVTFTVHTESATDKSTIGSSNEFDRVLRDAFDLRLGDDAARLWRTIEARASSTAASA